MSGSNQRPGIRPVKMDARGTGGQAAGWVWHTRGSVLAWVLVVAWGICGIGCKPAVLHSIHRVQGDFYVDHILDGVDESPDALQQRVSTILSTAGSNAAQAFLTVDHPYDRAVFPKDMAAPLFSWQPHRTTAALWLIRFDFPSTSGALFVLSNVTRWIPEKEVWRHVKEKTVEQEATVTIYEIQDNTGGISAQATVRLSTSRHTVEAPILYQQMMIPISIGALMPESSRWLLGDVSSNDPPKVLLQNQPVCGMCHHVSADGRRFGIDMDIGGDKGAYGIGDVEKNIVLKKENFFSWTKFQNDGNVTLGLFSKISPDGRHVVSTIREKRVFIKIRDLDFSELFFPYTGMLACYAVQEKRFFFLSGADDPDFVHVGADWKPDGKELVFSRARAKPEFDTVMKGKPDITADRFSRITDLNRRHPIRYDLYRIPFNNGRGGTPVPLEGAAGNGKSNYWPRYSPDGKWIVFTQSDNALMNQPESALFIVSAEGGKSRRLDCSRAGHNSWHSWSPNGKWLVFTSKVNTPYTELFLAHVSEDGTSGQPVLLSRFNHRTMASVLPEFVNLAPDGLEKITVEIPEK